MNVKPLNNFGPDTLYEGSKRIRLKTALPLIYFETAVQQAQAPHNKLMKKSSEEDTMASGDELRLKAIVLLLIAVLPASLSKKQPQHTRKKKLFSWKKQKIDAPCRGC